MKHQAWRNTPLQAPPSRKWNWSTMVQIHFTVIIMGMLMVRHNTSNLRGGSTVITATEMNLSFSFRHLNRNFYSRSLRHIEGRADRRLYRHPQRWRYAFNCIID